MYFLIIKQIFDLNCELINLIPDQYLSRITALSSYSNFIFSGNFKGWITVYTNDSFSTITKFQAFERSLVMSIIVNDKYIFTGGGKDEPIIKVWDFVSYSLLKVLNHKNSVLTMNIFNNILLSGDRNGIIKVF